MHTIEHVSKLMLSVISHGNGIMSMLVNSYSGWCRPTVWMV
jgi:hypothetical protein